VQHVSDLHPKFALRPHHVADIQSARKKRNKKKKEEEKKLQDENIMVCPIP